MLANARHSCLVLNTRLALLVRQKEKIDNLLFIVAGATEGAGGRGGEKGKREGVGRGKSGGREEGRR